MINRAHPIERMRQSGTVTPLQYQAFRQIELVSIYAATERLTDRGMGLQPRQQTGPGVTRINEGLARLFAIEGLKLLKLWSRAVPHPRKMHLEMIIGDRPLVDIADRHGLHWRTARKRLLIALDLWNELAAKKGLAESASKSA